MRLEKLLPVFLILATTGCSGVQFSRGIPVLAKSPDGLWIRDANGLPDLQRGRQARLSGRLDDAQRDLLPLANRGYPDAQMSLAAVFGQLESPHAQDQAILWYRTALPRRPEAVVPLARVYMREGGSDSVLEAERLLVQAQNDPAASAALLDLYGLFPLFDVEGRAPALAEAAAVSKFADLRIAAINWYRAALAEPGHARRLLELCRENLDVAPLCFVDLATYYRYTADLPALDAVVTEAMTALRYTASTANFDRFDYDPVALPPIASRLAVALIDQPLADDLAEVGEELALEARAETQIQTTAGDESVDANPSLDATPQYADAARGVAAQPAVSVANAHPQIADRLLRWMLEQPGAMPVEAAGVAVAFPYLLPDVDLEAVLSAGVAAGLPSASLYLGQLYYFDQRAPRDALLVEQNLKRSLEFRETAAPGHFRLGRLYQQGYLGRPDPDKALEHFLYAARHRVTAADTHLARLFYDTPGIRIDRVNSFVFARLAEDGGHPVVVHSLRSGQLSSYRLLERLGSELTAQELQRAESLYLLEKEVHRVARPRVAPDLWVKEAG